MLGPETYDTREAWRLRGDDALARGYVAISWAHLTLAYTLAIAGIVRGARSRSARHLTLVVVLTFGYFLIISGPEVYARFRMPLMPLVAALGGLAFMRPDASGAGAPACG
jgi:uncharacterized RDD family membrane protein YckC